MIIKVDILKCNGQWLRSMYKLVILTMLDRYLLLFTTTLRYFHETWSGLRVNELLHFLIVFLKFSIEKRGHSNKCFKEMLSNRCIFTWQFYAKFDKASAIDLQVWYIGTYYIEGLWWQEVYASWPNLWDSKISCFSIF